MTWLNSFECLKEPKLEINPHFNLDALGDAIQESGDEAMIKLFQEQIDELNKGLLQAIKEAEQMKSMKEMDNEQQEKLRQLMIHH